MVKIVKNNACKAQEYDVQLISLGFVGLWLVKDSGYFLLQMRASRKGLTEVECSATISLPMV